MTSQKSNMADVRHCENGFIAISAVDDWISTKFNERMHIFVPRMVTRQRKIKILQI